MLPSPRSFGLTQLELRSLRLVRWARCPACGSKQTPTRARNAVCEQARREELQPTDINWLCECGACRKSAQTVRLFCFYVCERGGLTWLIEGSGYGQHTHNQVCAASCRIRSYNVAAFLAMKIWRGPARPPGHRQDQELRVSTAVELPYFTHYCVYSTRAMPDAMRGMCPSLSSNHSSKSFPRARACGGDEIDPPHCHALATVKGESFTMVATVAA